jgi:hypothetical protein
MSMEYGVEVIADVGSIEAQWLLQQPCGSLAMLAAMRRASSRVGLGHTLRGLKAVPSPEDE